MEKEHGYFLKTLGTQVAEPLRAMVMGAPLVDARHLAQRYERIRQEAESQLPELVKKLESAEAKLQDLKSNMTILSKEAVSAMTAVEDQQQNQTLQRLIKLYR
ncbi:hypothetical protein F2Q69_00008547 [Brassica cretica]|uniref:Uncharacterized protein n=1 Tax=Brassica cretica TaxID=69181 RepID=A0A8S9NSY4_BRACR|nr:hypothetical protein F2Q69_00008547 [Brassica cretica]